MSQLHFPWIELCVLAPLLGAVWLTRRRDAEQARKWALAFSGMALAAAAGAWLDFQYSQLGEADDRWSLLSYLLGWEPLVIDRLSAPLLPLVALLFFLAHAARVHTEFRGFSFVLNLLAEAVVLATFCSKSPWLIVGLLAIGAALPLIEFRMRHRSCRAYCLYMGLFVALMVAGQFDMYRHGQNSPAESWALPALAAALLIRCGIAPFHSWIPDLFDRATFSTALLYIAPLVGAYGLLRLVLPSASTDFLHVISLVAMGSALYASAMALVQQEGRAFFSFLLISHSSIVVAGLLTMEHNALVGSLCVWLSITISLGGLGLTLRALEARRGRLRMSTFQGLYEHTPTLAMCFALTGLASVGFPGTFGFIGAELLVDGLVDSQPVIGVLLVVVAAMNGIAIMQAFFRLFGGTQYFSSVSLAIRGRERYAVLALAALILLGGLFPQNVVTSRSRAAEEILDQRGIARSDERHAERAPADALSVTE